MASAIEEEFLHISAPSRLDYFKNGVQYEKRVLEKKRQLSGSLVPSEVNENRKSDDESPMPKKLKSNKNQESTSGKTAMV
eukprot:CAMPEP_0113934842 /NCGR_PEP_ID=MMETSP1339-20121228/2102_1 /TAXON_ID=94617 /ORGANISM="Fibrocapsa japonica" /LENGTH=79 /DNA_ID=CAMNT_0000936787 /DNA_START=315 /DNA_END=554 /DNA_ORIENTATION=+ /assembly_acc=CAM_ASM_000762